MRTLKAKKKNGYQHVRRKTIIFPHFHFQFNRCFKPRGCTIEKVKSDGPWSDWRLKALLKGSIVKLFC